MKKKRTIKGYFIAGLLVVVPAFITFYVLKLIVGFMTSLTSSLPPVLRASSYLPYHIPGIEIVITIFAIFVIGVLATNFLGDRLILITEGLVDKIPFLRTVYRGSKQFMETFFSDEREGFSSVVIIEYPRKGIYCLAFVTGRTKGEVQNKVDEETINLFLPTTPNPTSGFYLVVPKKDAIPLDMSVEDAFKVIMTGGMVVPGNQVEGKTPEEATRDLISIWRLY